MMQGKHRSEAEVCVRIDELVETFEAKLQDSQEALKRIKWLFGKGAEPAPGDDGEKKPSGADGG
ncbi:MAG: hypothetical protein QGH74_06275 [Candidatus Brocadiia bacterium]|jgi:hypothetical protein|nr:hypothetical protein [Candidatus Brocadiia bacterium]